MTVLGGRVVLCHLQELEFLGYLGPEVGESFVEFALLLLMWLDISDEVCMPLDVTTILHLGEEPVKASSLGWQMTLFDL